MLSGKEIIEKIRRSPKIPAPSQTVFRVLSMTRNPDCDLSKAATLISSDAGLTAQLLREANTTGSKANDSAMLHDVILIKEELERIREQAENLE